MLHRSRVGVGDGVGVGVGVGSRHNGEETMLRTWLLPSLVPQNFNKTLISIS